MIDIYLIILSKVMETKQGNRPKFTPRVSVLKRTTEIPRKWVGITLLNNWISQHYRIFEYTGHQLCKIFKHPIWPTIGTLNPTIEMHINFTGLSIFPLVLAPVAQKMYSGIHRVNHYLTNCVIQWIVIYPVGSFIHLLNNWRQMKTICLKIKTF